MPFIGQLVRGKERLEGKFGKKANRRGRCVSRITGGWIGT